MDKITFDDFAKLEIRIGTILSAEKVPDGDKLLKLQVDFGDEKRQIMAAIALFYPDPEVLIGKQTPVVTNLEPRKFKGHESQGMIIATDNEEGIVLLTPEKKVPSGARVH